jgi:hypothetical protein
VIGVPGYPDWYLSDAALSVQIDRGMFTVDQGITREYRPTGRTRIIIEGDATRVEPYAQAMRQLLIADEDFRQGTAGTGP